MGVPGFVLPPPAAPPLELPPQPVLAATIAAAESTSTTAQPRGASCCRRANTNSRHAAVKTAIGKMRREFANPEGPSILLNATDLAVVVTVSIVIVVPFVPSVTIAGLKLHELSEGRPAQFDAESDAEPENPLNAVSVMVVEPLCPGVLTLMLVGFAIAVSSCCTTGEALPTEGA